MFEKMSDGEIMVYLRNAALQMSRIAQERGITVDVRCTEHGYINVMVGDYEIIKLKDDCEISYDYMPAKADIGFIYRLRPQQIRFRQKPTELTEVKHER